MTTWTDSEYFKYFRNKASFEKNKKFLKWLRERNPGKEVHHLLGSTVGKKFTDYLVVMVTREEHKEAEPEVGDTGYKKAIFFMIHLPDAIRNLIDYIIHLEGE